MAKCGNHGQIIPRDAELMTRLYWTEQHTLPEIGAMFGVTHKSVLRIFRELGVPTRPRGKASKIDRGCIECGAPVFRIKHAGNDAMYGRRCKLHWRKHRAGLTAAEAKTEIGRARRKRLFARWYCVGPINPQGELQWIRKGKALLRTAKRYLANRKSRAALLFQSEASTPAPTSPASCRRS